MKQKIYCLMTILILFSVTLTIQTTADTQTQPEQTPALDPVWIRGTLFGKIANSVLEENEYGTLYLTYHAINVFLIGHYYGFGGGPAFIHIKNRDIQNRYGEFPGFKGWYSDTYILGRYDGL